MTTVDFYLTQDPTIESSYKLVCQLVDKAYQQKRSVYIHANSEKETQILDDLLWTFRDDAFIPHSLYSQSELNIQLGYDSEPKKFNDILINLTQETPTFFQQFQRILEIVPQSSKEQARQKFRFYRDKNCEITTHDLTKDPC